MRFVNETGSNISIWIQKLRNNINSLYNLTFFFQNDHIFSTFRNALPCISYMFSQHTFNAWQLLLMPPFNLQLNAYISVHAFCVEWDQYLSNSSYFERRLPQLCEVQSIAQPSGWINGINYDAWGCLLLTRDCCCLKCGQCEIVL